MEKKADWVSNCEKSPHLGDRKESANERRKSHQKNREVLWTECLRPPQNSYVEVLLPSVSVVGPLEGA